MYVAYVGEGGGDGMQRVEVHVCGARAGGASVQHGELQLTQRLVDTMHAQLEFARDIYRYMLQHKDDP